MSLLIRHVNIHVSYRVWGNNGKGDEENICFVLLFWDCWEGDLARGILQCGWGIWAREASGSLGSRQLGIVCNIDGVSCIRRTKEYGHPDDLALLETLGWYTRCLKALLNSPRFPWGLCFPHDLWHVLFYSGKCIEYIIPVRQLFRSSLLLIYAQ